METSNQGGSEVQIYEEIGEIISDSATPTFEVFTFKAFHNKFPSPGSIVSIEYTKNKFILGRISNSHEHNPHQSVDQKAAQHALNIQPEYPGEDSSFTIYRTYEVEVMDEIHIVSGNPIIRPCEVLPRSGQKVIIPSSDFIYALLGLSRNITDGLNLGKIATNLSAESEVPVILRKDIIQRHVFIGGTTGGGKSYAAKVLAEEIHKHKIPIIFFDTQYEFVPITEKLNGVVLIPGTNYKVRLSSLDTDELSGLTPTVNNDLHVQILTSAFLRLKEINRNFNSQQLLTEIDTVSDEITTGKQGETTKWYVHSRTEYHLNQYNFIGDGFDWKTIIKPGAIIDVNCRGANRQRLQLILAATLRELQTLRQHREILPYVIFIDEAHLFVPQDDDSACKQIIREGVRVGRHNGICFVLITQSPIDIDKKAIRQCNTRLLFAIEPDQLIALQGVKADATDEMLNRLPKSPQGTCIISGTYETIKHAIPVKIRKMETANADGGQTPDIFSETSKHGTG